MMSAGSQEITRLSAAYLTSIAFGIAFLVAVFTGVDGLTALWRAVIAGGCALVAANFLAPPVVDVVLNALARDEAKRKASAEKEES
ncbi:MAG: dihydrodipicolinate synthase/N-acetylneuraminate lyase [Planctomycetota bacterium]|jgi:dihydrodipicolinate synthase/N-acetylneuraminate lyase